MDGAEGLRMDDGLDAFDAIAEEFRREVAWEQRTEAREIIAAGISDSCFADVLTRVAPGDVVTVVASDGVPLRGRLLAVGRDWLRLGEVIDPTGTGRTRVRRTHDVRLEAVVRIIREAG